MKRQPPFDPAFYLAHGGAVDGIYNADPAAAYVNGNPATGSPGSIPPMESVDHPQRELEELITSAALAPSATVLYQVAEATARYASKGVGGTATKQGTNVNAHTLTKFGSARPPKEYFDGQLLIYDAPATNTGPVKVNAYENGDKDVVDYLGQVLVGGEFVIGRPTALRYRASISKLVLLPWASALTSSAPAGGGTGGTGGTGGGAGSGIAQQAIFDIPSSYCYSLYNDLVSRGYNLSQAIHVVASLRTNSICGGSLALPAFRTGSGYAAGSVIELVFEPNSHRVGFGGTPANGEASGLGNGSAGGDAFLIETACTIDDRGVTAGGGGGGARNGPGNANWAGTGPGGVSGGGYGAGVHTSDPATFKNVFSYFYALAYWNTAGNYTNGGAAGGEWGQAGSSAGAGTVGGAPGRAIIGNSLATWTNTGTRYGAIV